MKRVIIANFMSAKEVEDMQLSTDVKEINFILKGDDGYKSITGLFNKNITSLYKKYKDLKISLDTSKPEAIRELSNLVNNYDAKITLCCNSPGLTTKYYLQIDYKMDEIMLPAFHHKFNGLFCKFLMFDKIWKICVDSSATLNDRNVLRAIGNARQLETYEYIVMNADHLQQVKLYHEKEYNFRVWYVLPKAKKGMDGSLRGIASLRQNQIFLNARCSNMKTQGHYYQSFVSRQLKNKNLRNRAFTTLRLGGYIMFFYYPEIKMMQSLSMMYGNPPANRS